MTYPHPQHLALDVSKHQGVFNPRAALMRDFTVIIGRCSIGYAPRDPRYLENKIKTEKFGMPWLSYSVNWPINRQPAREAIATASLLTDTASPLMPIKVIADIELGVLEHRAGHHTIPGQELYEINKEYILTLQKQVAPIEVIIYTGNWYWNNVKLNAHIDGYEKGFRLWHAAYLDVALVGDQVDPYAIRPTYNLTIPHPWQVEDLFAWQWTSKGQGRKFGISDSISIDQNVIYDKLPDSTPPPDGDIDHSEIVSRLDDLETWRARIADVTQIG
ncbi:hypothetical protein LCGC14_1116730 [marine sediment metagenome]|uniref:Uncharacterized protein n=1 Tax=marine sediment metagenome TaxID=412755 RepID=A0A0F9QAZ8_9ZZZZ